MARHLVPYIPPPSPEYPVITFLKPMQASYGLKRQRSDVSSSSPSSLTSSRTQTRFKHDPDESSTDSDDSLAPDDAGWTSFDDELYALATPTSDVAVLFSPTIPHAQLPETPGEEDQSEDERGEDLFETLVEVPFAPPSPHQDEEEKFYEPDAETTSEEQSQDGRDEDLHRTLDIAGPLSPVILQAHLPETPHEEHQFEDVRGEDLVESSDVAGPVSPTVPHAHVPETSDEEDRSEDESGEALFETSVEVPFTPPRPQLREEEEGSCIIPCTDELHFSE
jgi:hypothetical protein